MSWRDRTKRGTVVPMFKITMTSTTLWIPTTPPIVYLAYGELKSKSSVTSVCAVLPQYQYPIVVIAVRVTAIAVYAQFKAVAKRHGSAMPALTEGNVE